MTNYSPNEQAALVALGLRLRKYRLESNLSQEELAHNCGLHRTYIGSAERGERNISFLNIVKLSLALGIRPDKLLSD